MCNVDRTPIKVTRKPITTATELGRFMGGWFPFPIPNEGTPFIKTRGKDRVLWCPYCGAWTVFSIDNETGAETCTAMCGVSTNDFYTRKFNKLF